MIPHDMEGVLGRDPVVDGRLLTVRREAVKVPRDNEVHLLLQNYFWVAVTAQW